MEACRGGNFGPELPSFAGSPVETSTLIRRYYWQATSTSVRSWERVLVEKELGPFRAEGAKLLVPRTQRKRVKRVLLLILVDAKVLEEVDIVVVIIVVVVIFFLFFLFFLLYLFFELVYKLV